MEKIDSHHHLWKFNEQDYGWMSKQAEIIRKDYLPEDLAVVLKKSGYTGSVAVQARQTEEENTFLMDCARESDLIRGIVGWVDLRSPDIEERLAYWSTFKEFKGIRHVVHDEPDVDFILREAFLNGVSKLNQYNLTYDLLIHPVHLKNTIKFVSRFPEQKFVIDHIAKPEIGKGILEPWATEMRELARYENVYCKLSGMVTETKWKNWVAEDFHPYMDVVFEAFGAERLMIGSDWPVCRLSGEYQEVMKIVEEYISDKDKEKILAGNSINFYNL